MRFVRGVLSTQGAGEVWDGSMTLIEVGSVTPDPTYNLNGSTHQITSAGGAYNTETAGFAYMTIPLQNFRVTARLASWTTGGERPRMGIYFRNPNTAPSKICASNSIRFLSGNYYHYGYARRRADLTYSGYASPGNVGSSIAGVRDWLRLELNASTGVVTFLYSGDGVNWTSQGTTNFLDVSGGDEWDKGGVLQVGMVVSANNTLVEFDNFDVTLL